MIHEKDILPVGHTRKPHGIRGEITLLFQKAAYTDLDATFYFLEIDGIPVPFFVEEFTGTTDVGARVKFEHVEDEMEASKLVDKKVFLPREMVLDAREEEEDDWNFFIGFEVVDQHGEYLGKIREVDDSTLNVLFVVARDDEEEQLIPATEDFISAIDEENRRVEMHLPEGLLEK